MKVLSCSLVDRSVYWFSITVLLYSLYNFGTLMTVQYKLIHFGCYLLIEMLLIPLTVTISYVCMVHKLFTSKSGWFALMAGKTMQLYFGRTAWEPWIKLFVLFTLQSPWKLALVYLLCDTYVKWQEVQPLREHGHVEDYIFYAALEWDIYKIFAVTLAGMWLLFRDVLDMLCDW